MQDVIFKSCIVQLRSLNVFLQKKQEPAILTEASLHFRSTELSMLIMQYPEITVRHSAIDLKPLLFTSE